MPTSKNDPVIFDRQSATRITRAVKNIERSHDPDLPLDNVGDSENFFWATLSNQVVGSGAYIYDFTEITFPGGSVTTGGRKTSGTSLGQVGTVNLAACNMSKPALIRQDIIGTGASVFTIVTEGLRFATGLKKFMVLQMTSDATGPLNSIPGNYGWDFPLIHG